MVFVFAEWLAPVRIQPVHLVLNNRALKHYTVPGLHCDATQQDRLTFLCWIFQKKKGKKKKVYGAEWHFLDPGTDGFREVKVVYWQAVIHSHEWERIHLQTENTSQKEWKQVAYGDTTNWNETHSRGSSATKRLFILPDLNMLLPLSQMSRSFLFWKGSEISDAARSI